MTPRSTAASTQEHLPIAGVQDDVIIMNDGSIRVVLKVEPINFDLKSEEEQNGIIYSYQGFLNSLEFPIQILIQSKKLDLEHYLVKLEGIKKDTANDLLRIQTEDYVEFVRRLISVANIMSKRFFVVVSYSIVGKNAGLSGIFEHKATGPLLDQEQFDRLKAEAFNRANTVSGGLGRIGLRCSIQNTQQLIEMFYNAYNPDVATEERITDIDNLNATVISSFMPPPAPSSEEIIEPESHVPETPVEPVVEEPIQPEVSETPLRPEDIAAPVPEPPAPQPEPETVDASVLFEESPPEEPPTQPSQETTL